LAQLNTAVDQAWLSLTGLTVCASQRSVAHAHGVLSDAAVEARRAELSEVTASLRQALEHLNHGHIDKARTAVLAARSSLAHPDEHPTPNRPSPDRRARDTGDQPCPAPAPSQSGLGARSAGRHDQDGRGSENGEAGSPRPRQTRRRGRRPANEDTRAELVNAAATVFTEQGFEGATVRAIADRAGTDPSMVYHWFGNKRALFDAIIQPPFDAVADINHALSGDPAALGERAARTFLTAWDQHRERFNTIMRHISVHSTAAAMLQDHITTAVADAVAAHLDVDRPRYRASLVTSYLAGLAMTRYLIQMEPLASTPVEQIVTTVGPTLQHWLTGDIE
jgi:AcrR family transcriptional regulator